MNNYWTKEQIKSILEQLNQQNLPFKNYELDTETLLGEGGYARVYQAFSKKNKKKEYAVKVIGFHNKNVDSFSFYESVEMQKKLSSNCDTIVRIYDSIEMYVQIEGESTITDVELYLDEDMKKGNRLHLQCILMEKLSPIWVQDGFQERLYPASLTSFDENEILKLATDIECAVHMSHDKKLLHRDIKPQNIFYDDKKKRYKLGDFGIARKTYDGFANTAVYTMGYGAPEVSDSQYDFTADIYSFGMTLYILLNELKFPETAQYQYTEGYVPPRPKRGSDMFVDIILKMVAYNPDDRYQSMQEVKNNLYKLEKGFISQYHYEHRGSFQILAIFFLLIGIVLWKMAFHTSIGDSYSIGQCIFIGLCLLQGILHLYKVDTDGYCILVSFFGIYLLIQAHLSIGLSILIGLFLFLFVMKGASILGLCCILVRVTSMIMEAKGYSTMMFCEYRWLSVLFLSLCFVVLYTMYLQDYCKVYNLKNNRFLALMSLFYLLLVPIQHFFFTYTIYFPFFPDFRLTQEQIEWIQSLHLNKVGFWGLAVCLILWMQDWYQTRWKKV